MAENRTPRGRETKIAILLIAAAAVARILLATGSPQPVGYVYDLYHKPILKYAKTGEIPPTRECFMCYHPPLYTLVGERVFALGQELGDGDKDFSLRTVAFFSTLIFAAFAWVAYRIVCVYVSDPRHRLVSLALLLVLPVLFISSFAIESDLLTSLFMLGALLAYLRYERSGHHPGWVVAMGVLSGLGASTKYSALAIVAALGLLLGLQLVRTRKRAIVTHALVYALLCVALGSWRYVENYREQGVWVIDSEAKIRAQRFARRKGVRFHTDEYRFADFRLGEFIDILRPDSPEQELKHFPAYDESVWTSIYGQFWTDGSVFSNPSRHGLRRGWYPTKPIPMPLVTGVLVFGLVPLALTGVGFVLAFGRLPGSAPLLVLFSLGAGAYTYYLLGFNEWILKAKYLLFLIPGALVWISWALSAAGRTHPHLERGLLAWLWVLVAAAYAYDVAFAVL